jgi:hypothetical protein
MKYTKSRSGMKKGKEKSLPWMWIIVALILIGAIVWVVTAFSDDEVVVDDDVEVVGQGVDEEGDVIEDILDTESFEQINLADPDGRGYAGIARRGIENDLFTHVVVAELPAINTDAYFYEGWLVQPGVLQFFSTGEMFAREDGKWGLVWEVQENDQLVEVTDFPRAVITLEPRDGDPAPAADHVLEGDFIEDIEFSGFFPF